MRSPLFDLEEGSHHVMVRNYSQLDEVSYLSDQTGLESTPPKPSARRVSFLTPKQPTRIRKPWSYLKRVIQRQRFVNDTHVLDQQAGQKVNYSQRVQTSLAPPSRKINLLLSPVEPQNESDPLLLFEQSSRSFSQRSPSEFTNKHSEMSRTELSTQLDSQNTIPRSYYTQPIFVAVFLYTLLVLACVIDLLGLSTSLQTIVLGIGTAALGVYLLQLPTDAEIPIDSPKIG